jgi:anti-sigma B factor antagonist
LIDGDILAIVLHESLDSASTPDFEAEVNRHLEAGRTKIIIDCRRLGYLSSLGVGALVTLRTRLTRRGGDVKLASVQGAVMNFLRLMRLDKFFEIHGDLEFARRAFQTGETYGDAALQ